MIKINNTFNYEQELVRVFINHYNKFHNDIVIPEMPIRFGNIDVVSIKSNELPFSRDQIKILSKPAGALVYTKIKNERPISKKGLLLSIGLSQSTLENILYELERTKLVFKKNNNYLRKEKFIFPKTIVKGYEAKLTDFNKAFYQARNNKEYVDYSYLVFPMKVANNIIIKRKKLLQEHGIGLIGVSESNSKQLLQSRKSNKMRNHIRLLNLAKANLISSK